MLGELAHVAEGRVLQPHRDGHGAARLPRRVTPARGGQRAAAAAVQECCSICGGDDIAPGAAVCSSCQDNFAPASEESEESDDEPFGGRRNRPPKKKAKSAAAVVPLDRSHRLEATDEELVLSEVQKKALEDKKFMDGPLKENNINLMKLFWQHGWRKPETEADLSGGPDSNAIVPLAHQWEGIRFVAGVHDKFPTEFPVKKYTRGGLDGTAYSPTPHGVGGGILADVMGLGKTIECIAGAFLREICHAKLGFDAQLRNTLCVAPNQQVLEQWRATAIKAGIGESTIGVYTGDKKPSVENVLRQTTPPRMTLLTIHTMLADERGAFKTFRPTPGSADKVTFTPSPLAPYTPAEQAFHSELSTSLLLSWVVVSKVWCAQCLRNTTRTRAASHRTRRRERIVCGSGQSAGVPSPRTRRRC